jgi:site-specific DNA recombinase
MNKEVLHIYTRVSSSGQVKGHSLAVQQEKGIERARELAYDYVLHEEPGQSARYEDLENRPVLYNLIQQCLNGDIKHVFVTNIDRLSRNVKLYITLSDIFLANNITLHTLYSSINPNSSEERLAPLLQSVFSEHENLKRIEKIKHSLKRAVIDKGRWIGTNIPYGYERGENGQLQVNSDEKKVYLKMVEMTLAGFGTNRVAKELNRLNIRTRGVTALKTGIKLPKNDYRFEEKFVRKEDLRWAPNSIRSIIKNPIYKGRRRFKGEELDTPELKIISESKWVLLQIQHKSNKNSPSTTRKYFYLLKSMLRCSHCGRNLVGRIKPKDKEYYYQCSSKRIAGACCELRSPNINQLDKYVWKTLVHMPNSIKTIKDVVSTRNKGRDDLIKKQSSIKKEIDAVKQRIRNLLLLFETDRITLAQYDERSDALGKQLSDLEIEFKSISNKIDFDLDTNLKNIYIDFGNPALYLTDLTDEEKRKIILSLVENIQVEWIPELKKHRIKITVKTHGLTLVSSGFLQNYYTVDGKKIRNRENYSKHWMVLNWSDIELVE